MKLKPITKATKYKRLKKMLMISAAIPGFIVTLMLLALIPGNPLANPITVAVALFFQIGNGAVLLLTLFAIALAFRTPTDPETKSPLFQEVVAAAIANLMPTSLVFVIMDSVTNCPEYQNGTADVCNEGSNIFDLPFTPIAATIYLLAWAFLIFKAIQRKRKSN